MAAKRSASTDLNHCNWDEENEPEEAGVFEKAAGDVLEKRVIKAARRRLTNSPRDGAGKSAFDAFKGFKTNTSSAASPFSFLANTSTAPSSSSLSGASVTTAKSAASNGAPQCPENGTDKTGDSSKHDSLSNTPATKLIATVQEDKKIFKKSTDYFAKLKGLNESVAQWIKTHVDTNPFCILTPIFRDYDRYLKEIESTHGTEIGDNNAMDKTQTAPPGDATVGEAGAIKKASDSSPFVGGASSKTSSSAERKPESVFGSIGSNSKLMFGKADQKTDSSRSIFGNAESIADAPKSIFGNMDLKADSKSVFRNINTEKNPFLNKPPSVLESKPEEGQPKSEEKAEKPTSFSSSSSSSATTNINTTTFSFGQSSATSNISSAGFSFGSAKPFSFGAQVAKPQDPEDKAENDVKDDEDEEPPKPDFKPITEEGAVYKQRCKVFVKKDGNFSDRGVGTLFLKPTPYEKTQLIVRAETSLGNLLINTLLTKSIPIKRMNKNTIMMVCLPLPESQPPPTPVLLRVKTPEEADALLETLKKHEK